MKKLVVGVLYAFCMLTAVHSGDIGAQTGTGTAVGTTTTQGTTPNLITSGSTHTWYGTTTGALPDGYMPGGPQPIYDPNTNTITFSYGNASVGQTYAVNQALASVGAGVKINGYNYSYDVRNMNGDDRQGSIDTFTVSQLLRGPQNSVLLSSSQYYNTKFEWKTVSGTKTATTPYNIADTSYIQFGISGMDNGYWGGYFGPQVRNVNMSLNYTAAPVVQHTMGDDGYVNVPLQFGFPFYGKVFTNSFMFDNGVVGFFDPVAGGCNPANGFCGGQQWNAQPFSNNMGNQFSYMIAPAWADLAPNSQTRYLTQGDSTFQKYTWENIGQYYDQSKLQTFDLTIKPSGFIGVNYGNINLNQTNLGIGTIGNPALGEYTQIGFYNAGTNITTSSVANWSMNQTQAVDLCVTNPLSSPSCPNYATAYLSQQCSISALYSPSCPGYASAYFSQQCSANPLYNTSCPGYASAYLDYQCSVDPLYSTTCQGYTQAYHDQQCSINPLYATDCVGYSTAYFNQQCTADPLYSTQCSGYAAAYKTQQCTANPLYATDCPGYAVAYKAQQCTASALYATDCPGYAQAYFNQQCTLSGLYSNQCPNYSEAYAKKMLLEQQGMASTVATAGTVAQVAQVAAVAAADPTNATSTATSSAISSDSNVAAAVTVKTPTAASTDTQPAAAVKLTAPPPAPAMQMAQAEPKKDSGPAKEEKKEEGAKKNDNGPSSAGPSGDSKPSDQPKSNREALQERRREAAQKEAVAKGGNLANEMGKAADMEAQKAVQNVVIAAMGFTPGFDTYNKAMIPDTTFYKPYTVYGNQKVIDNRVLSRGLTGGSDRTHQEMVDSQYNRGN
jgi:hypothetical protein